MRTKKIDTFKIILREVKEFFIVSTCFFSVIQICKLILKVIDETAESWLVCLYPSLIIFIVWFFWFIFYFSYYLLRFIAKSKKINK